MTRERHATARQRRGRRHAGIPVVIVSGVRSGEQLERSREAGAADCFEKLGLVARIPELVERHCGKVA